MLVPIITAKLERLHFRQITTLKLEQKITKEKIEEKIKVIAPVG